MTASAQVGDGSGSSVSAGSVASVAYLGPRGTFSEEAVLADTELRRARLVPCDSIEEALEAVLNGVTEAAFVPIENSLGGPVAPAVDGLRRRPELSVRTERVLEVRLCLLGLPGATLAGLAEIVSFSPALAQCSRFLAEALPGVVRTEASSTAEAARLVSLGGRLDLAAVAGARAASLYGLEVLADGIEDPPGSRTRFVLVSRR